MSDFDVALVKHFLTKGASDIGDKALANAIERWAYQGPGVWDGIDEIVLATHRHIFSAGIKIAEALGEKLSLDYLNSNVRITGGRWLKEQSTSEVVIRIRELEEHFHEST